MYMLISPESKAFARRYFSSMLLLVSFAWFAIAPYSCFSQAPAGPIERHKEVTNSIGMRLAYIPAGKFMIGSPTTEQFRQQDEAQTEITISKSFYMGVYEVTQVEFEKVTGSTPSTHKPDENEGSNQLPVDGLGIKGAEQFCMQLSGLEVEKKAGRRYRLPSEAEWEYACRAGTTTAYYFGDSVADLEKHAWTPANAEGKPHPVGKKLPNPWGLHDMYGNVQEMCSGYYSDYAKSPATDLKGGKRSESTPDFFKLPGGSLDTSNSKPVARGGAYFGNKIFSKGAYRSAKRTQLTLSKRPDLGFRVLMELTSNASSKP